MATNVDVSTRKTSKVWIVDANDVFISVSVQVTVFVMVEKIINEVVVGMISVLTKVVVS